MAGIVPLIQVQGDSDLNYSNQRCLITGFGVNQEANYQFLHTLGGSIYIYVFGDRVGTISISGIAATVDCGAGYGLFGDTSASPYGVERMMGWYTQNKISARVDPITIVVGTQTVINGYVCGSKVSIMDAMTWLTQFEISMALLPEQP